MYMYLAGIFVFFWNENTSRPFQFSKHPRTFGTKPIPKVILKLPNKGVWWTDHVKYLILADLQNATLVCIWGSYS